MSQLLRIAKESHRYNTGPSSLKEFALQESSGSIHEAEPSLSAASTASPASISMVRDMVARDFEQNVPVRNNRYHFRVYRNTFVGREAVDYLILAGYARTREEAVHLGRELCQELNLFEHVCRGHEFKDAFLFYRFIDPSLRKHPSDELSRLSESEGADGNDRVADWPVEKLTQIYNKLQKNLVTTDRKYRLKRYSQCFVASEAVDFMVGSEIVDRRSDAVKLGRRLQKELGAFHHVVYEHDFQDDYLFFQWKQQEIKTRRRESLSSRSPQAILEFWLGPLREPADMNEGNWRNRMNQWRVGIFVGAKSADPKFVRYQKDWCDALVRSESLMNGWETEPYGALAKLLVLDQFIRTVYRGTPVAFNKGTEIANIFKSICYNEWDEKVLNVVERMWVYMAAGQVEDKDLQDISIAKWTKWSSDIVTISSKENKEVNRKVGLHFLKLAVEQAEAVVWHGRFPHRNAVQNRPNNYAELQYLLSPTRPPWTKSQPLDPEFQALHALIHRIAPGESCNELSKSAIATFDDYFDLGGELLPLLFRGGKKSVKFEELYKHLRMAAEKTTFMEIKAFEGMVKTEQELCRIIYQDEISIWPPVFSQVPPVVDISKINAYIGCPLLVAPAEFSVSRSAIRDFQSQTGFQPDPIAKLYHRHMRRVAKTPAATQVARETLEEAVLDKDHFRAVIGPMFGRNQQTTINQMYDLIDVGHNKVLDSSELFIAMIIFGSGSIVEKAKLTVSYFDTNGDKRLSPEDMEELFEVCFLRCPIFLSSLFEDYGASVEDSDSDDGDGSVKIRDVQTLRRAHDMGRKTFEEVDCNNDGVVEFDEVVSWLQSEANGEYNKFDESKDLFLQLFRLNDMLFLDEL